MLKMIGAIVLTAIIGVGGYFGYQKYIQNKAIETTKVQDATKNKDALKDEDVQKVLQTNLDSILNTLNTLREKHKWGAGHPADFNIIRPEVLPFGTEEFIDTSLKELVENYYCDCDAPIFPAIQYDVRFEFKQNGNRLNISALEPADELNNMGIKREFQLIKENDAWKISGWKSESLQGQDLKLTKDEAEKLLTTESNTPTFVKEYVSKEGGGKAYLFKIEQANGEWLTAISSRDTQYLYDYQEIIENDKQAADSPESNSPTGDKASTTNIKVSESHYNDKDFLSYPQVSGVKSKSAEKNINEALTKAAEKSYQGYLSLMKEQEEIQDEDYCKEMPDSCQYAYSLSFEVKYNSNGKLCILYYDYQYTGGAHGNGIATLYNFDTKTGKQYRLDDILTNPALYSAVEEYAFNYLSTHEPFSMFVKNRNDFTVDQNTQFSYADDGIHLIFQEYEVASYAEGHPEILIPSSVYHQ